LVAFGTGIIQSVTIFVPEMAVTVFGVSTSQASFMLIPFVLAIAIGSPVAGRLIDKIGSRAIVMAGLLMAATGLLIFYYDSSSRVNFYTAGIFMGLGSAMLQGSALAIYYAKRSSAVRTGTRARNNYLIFKYRANDRSHPDRYNCSFIFIASGWIFKKFPCNCNYCYFGFAYELPAQKPK